MKDTTCINFCYIGRKKFPQNTLEAFPNSEKFMDFIRKFGYVKEVDVISGVEICWIDMLDRASPFQYLHFTLVFYSFFPLLHFAFACAW